MTEYRAGQIWLDTLGEEVIRHVTSPTEHTEVWLELNGSMYTRQPNTLIEKYKGELIHNPPAPAPAVGDELASLEDAMSLGVTRKFAMRSADGCILGSGSRIDDDFSWPAEIVWLEAKNA